MTAAIVAYRHRELRNIFNDIVNAAIRLRLALEGFIQVGNISLVVFSMVDLHRHFVDVRFQSIGSVGQCR